ncbi:ABC transporter permease [Tepidimicrobium xylanilyticum]|uniref:ABC-type antimicrobial peptide transport system, permease component n=1 Tax=Tepidimicrobium xylanilyticum TaxID=1123352 RepID=A0A1H2WPP8_9FIRM|nr:ABC transporter permease [Tepidimicrobium xylanilyticum]GMG95187.1 ABC transporter permease [Tepidimicrobium xylanilyticum]SDW82436.1 ABC-type antimicrobial peptide transport system, permease component [Tepidimicrobium xylanilyticum]
MMRTRDFFRMGFINLWRRKVRTILTALAMTVGVASIVVLVSIGLGYDQTYRETIEEMGSLTKIDVMPPRDKKGKVPLLNEKAVMSFKKLDGVEAVTPVLQVFPYLKNGKYITLIKLYGIDMKTAPSFQLIPLEGELPLKGTRIRPEIMLTDDVQDSFVDPETWEKIEIASIKKPLDPMKSNIRMSFNYESLMGEYQAGEDGRALPMGKNYRVQVTGICSNQNRNYDTSGFMEYEILEEIMKDNEEYMPSVPKEDEEDNELSKLQTYQMVWVKAEDTDSAQDVIAAIKAAGFETYSLNDMLESVRRQSKQIQGVLAAIGGVSLLVAGIGTANTMMMSINERTKEIGILKVLGSELTDIVKMFLVEAVIIGIIGGIIGLALSFGLQRLLPVLLKEMEVRSIIPPWLAVGGVLFAGLVAVISALGPAINAMRVSPQTAIRTE